MEIPDQHNGSAESRDDFTHLMWYAWYELIDDRPEHDRAEASRCLKVWLSTAWICFMEDKRLMEMTVDDFSFLKFVLDEHMGNRAASVTAFRYLLDSLRILSDRQLIFLDPADIATLA